MTTLSDIFVGKKVNVKIPARDNFGKKIPNKFVTITGICTFIGKNEWLGYELHTVVDRLPIELKHINDIQLVDEPNK